MFHGAEPRIHRRGREAAQAKRAQADAARAQGQARKLPDFDADRNDIITSIETGSPEGLCAVCQGVQAGSPVDSIVTPEPYAMPGYEDEVIMAAGAFTMGSSIELSCDGPMRAPYTAYLQGGLNFAASRAGLLLAAMRLKKG